MAISSQFYRDISKIEKKLWKVSFRQLKGYTLLIGVGAVLVGEVLVLPDWAFFLVTFPTALLLGTYPVLLITNRWKAAKRRISLNFIYEDRFFTVGQIRRYEKNEFTQRKTVKETDKIK
ncbi:hypothetical protein [Enterococcus faecalis]|uniref:hypothetical protein n=1 Tax=Enterococcus faecalis TaxID=1351 RepID=UPI000535222D|nr:hypothetical protein [Enterococcus faecalis]